VRRSGSPGFLKTRNPPRTRIAFLDPYSQKFN
jgi:hypothetical protein